MNPTFTALPLTAPSQPETMSAEMDAWLSEYRAKHPPEPDTRGPWTIAHEEGFDAGP
jgi:hypothetical protein